MANSLIKNETNVYYTVSVNESSYVKNVALSGSKVEKVDLRPLSKYGNTPWKSGNREAAIEVARGVGGKITKHTRTEVITEITEELEELEEIANEFR
ncbi:hypothetical protein J18TS1_12090 [Oceanobacillus oncorhynchi subsp. incaldanensis]|uniref:hypothetical protein n=1 Tax=Oceanobacillus oncorhynchi TaxID=545501 RepID=UPI001B12EC2F|nr:hypothetical protein [Oceanobacillus oncorhynchi]GIO18109.1 hypothetical protein J18TS1_12090 [Oceanobacillus oncorhynchi subsp. incaldanensis]